MQHGCCRKRRRFLPSRQNVQILTRMLPHSARTPWWQGLLVQYLPRSSAKKTLARSSTRTPDIPMP
eukprot:3545674-Amphidinium_carterae.1